MLKSSCKILHLPLLHEALLHNRTVTVLSSYTCRYADKDKAEEQDISVELAHIDIEDIAMQF